MNRLVRAALTAALALVAGPALAQQGYTPPPGYVLVPAPPPGSQLQPAPQAPQTALGSPVVQDRTWQLGFSGGVVFPGAFYAGDYDYDTKTAGRFGAFADFFLAQKFSMGVFADRLSFGIKDSDTTVAFTSLGASLVGHFGSAREGHLRLGVGISYEIGSSDRVDKDSSGFGVRAFLGYVVPVAPTTDLFFQGMIQGSPSGGNGDIDVTYGPLFSLNVGLQFGN